MRPFEVLQGSPPARKGGGRGGIEVEMPSGSLLHVRVDEEGLSTSGSVPFDPSSGIVDLALGLSTPY